MDHMLPTQRDNIECDMTCNVRISLRLYLGHDCIASLAFEKYPSAWRHILIRDGFWTLVCELAKSDTCCEDVY
jgi:hypothetical protein